jgi:hypothetical protein
MIGSKSTPARAHQQEHTSKSTPARANRQEHTSKSTPARSEELNLTGKPSLESNTVENWGKFTCTMSHLQASQQTNSMLFGK